MTTHKTRVAYVRLTPEDHAEIARLARHAGLSVSAFLRHAGMRLSVPPTVPAVNKAAWADLARSAANINQLAHHLNEARITGRAGTVDAGVLRQDLHRMYGHIAALRRLLIGEDCP